MSVEEENKALRSIISRMMPAAASYVDDHLIAHGNYGRYRVYDGVYDALKEAEALGFTQPEWD